MYFHCHTMINQKMKYFFETVYQYPILQRLKFTRFIKMTISTSFQKKFAKVTFLQPQNVKQNKKKSPKQQFSLNQYIKQIIKLTILLALIS